MVWGREGVRGEGGAWESDFKMENATRVEHNTNANKKNCFLRFFHVSHL